MNTSERICERCYGDEGEDYEPDKVSMTKYGLLCPPCYIEWRNRMIVEEYLRKNTMEQIKIDWEELKSS